MTRHNEVGERAEKVGRGEAERANRLEMNGNGTSGCYRGPQDAASSIVVSAVCCRRHDEVV